MDDCLILTPEKNALKILAALDGSFKPGYGCALSFTECLQSFGNRSPVAIENLNAGMRLAVQQGWIQLLEDDLLYRLTPAGFLKLSQRRASRYSLLSQFVL